MSFRDLEDTVLGLSQDVIGSDVTYTPEGEDAVTIKGIFDNAWVDDGDGLPSLKPTLRIKLDDLESSPGKGDSVEISSTSYRVLSSRNDGYGGATLILQEEQSMAHIRKEIRDAIVELLLDETDAGENVYANRETDLWEAELPAILVYTRDESATPRDLSGRTSIRTLQLIIEIKVYANTTLDDTLDAIALDVEDIMSAAQIAGTTGRPIYKSTQIELDSGSAKEKGVATLTFDIQYIQ